jgi:hypothetical protein
MIRAAQLSYSATVKWDLYAAKYDAGTQDHSAIGPGVEGWPTRPVLRVLELLTSTTRPRGGRNVDLVPGTAVDPAKLLTAYISPAGNISILGLHTSGGLTAPTTDAPVPYSIGGLPPNTLFRLLVWNADGTGTTREIGFLDSGPTGVVALSAPPRAVFALTNTPLGAVGP